MSNNAHMVVGYKRKCSISGKHHQKWLQMQYACNAFYYKGAFLWWQLSSTNSRAAYVCQLGSTPIVKQINVLNLKKVFGHFSLARLHEVRNYDLKKSQKKGMHCFLP
jgi:hypothetical protein